MKINFNDIIDVIDEIMIGYENNEEVVEAFEVLKERMRKDFDYDFKIVQDENGEVESIFINDTRFGEVLTSNGVKYTRRVRTRR